MSYISLHAHSDMSNLRLLDSLNKIPDMIDYCHKIGLSGLAITEHESVGSHVKAFQHLEKRKAQNKEDPTWQNFKLLLGNEIYLVRNGLNKDNFISGEDRYYHFILIAKDLVGHKQIRELSSRAWNRSYVRYLERVPTYYSDIEEVIGANPGHVIATTACIGGYLGTSLLRIKSMDPADRFMAQLDLQNWLLSMESIFGKGNFFMEMQPSLNAEQYYVNNQIIQLHEKLSIPYVITTDAHYQREEDRPIHKAYLNAENGDREVDDFYNTTFFMTPEKIYDYFTSAELKYRKEVDYDNLREVVKTALGNTIAIGEACEAYTLKHTPILPHIVPEWDGVIMPLPPNEQDYPYISKFLVSDYEQDRYLIGRVYTSFLQKFNEVYREKNEKRYMDRIEVECKEMWEISEKLGQRISSYLLTVSKIIELIWSDGDSLVGPSRGSALGFLTNFLLNITQINPLEAETELPHWRFINEHRVSLPDVDIDIQGNRRQRVLRALRKYFGEQRAVNVATFATEKSRAAIQTAARGLGIDSDVAQYISSMIPVDRGFNWPLADCFYGNAEEERAPIASFVHEMTENYPELWSVAQKIEGLISRRGIHAGGVIITNEDFVEHNALMRSPKGELTSQYELNDTEFMGGVKFDLLSVEAMDKLRTALDLLVEYRYIEPQETLKETYMATLGPENRESLLYHNSEIWDLAAKGEVLSLFQLDTPVGMDAVKRAKPRNISELAMINSLMRLMASEGEMPLDTFMRYKEDPALWDQEMREHGLKNNEIAILKEHLASHYGVAESQESMMMLAMDSRIAGFSVAEADSLRKAVAKKSMIDFERMAKLFYEKGRALGTSNELLEYVWERQIRRQKGYSFSALHTYGYSVIALQQLNLVYLFPPLFWNTANLIIDSAGGEAEELDEEEELELPRVTEHESNDVDDDDNDEEDNVPAPVKIKNKPMNYGKVGAALGKMQASGVSILPPDINTSKQTFTPDIERNAVLFGIKGITSIGDGLVLDIIKNRPYRSLKDLTNRVTLKKPNVVNLIKSGALDGIESGTREDIMRRYIYSISDVKSTLNLRNMQGLVNYNLVPQEMDFCRRLFNFNKYLKQNVEGADYILDDRAMVFFEEFYDNGLLRVHDSGAFSIPQDIWKKMYTKGMNPMRDYIKANLEHLLKQFNDRITHDLWRKYAKGSISRWEMDSLSFYHHEHELASVNGAAYGVENFFNMPEDPPILTLKSFGKRQYPIYRLYRIMGTVLGRDKLKRIVTLLTLDGVVNVRVWQSQFVKYDKQISVVGADGKKTIVEKSWFTRGNRLLITGLRRGDYFIPKVYSRHEYEHPFEIIDGVGDDGDLILKSERFEE